MQNFISALSPSKSFQFVNEPLSRERGSPHHHDCHGPPHPAWVGFPEDATRRRRLPWVANPDLWSNNRGEDYRLRDTPDEDGDPEEKSCALAALGPHLRPAAMLVACRAYLSCFPGT